MGNADIIQKLTDAEVQSLFDAFEERVDACAQGVLEKPAQKGRKFLGFSSPEADLLEEREHALKEYIRAYTHAYHASRGRLPKPQDLPFNSASSVREINRQRKKLPENLKTYRFKQWAEMPISDAAHVKELFGDALEKDGPQKGRMYFKINVPVVPDSIKDHLEKDGHYEVISNREVRETSENGRAIKISTVLANQFKFSRTSKESEHIGNLQKEHSLFLSRLSGDEVFLVASARPEDIIRCSTARPNMHSCFAEESLHGDEYNRHLPHMIQQGAVVFYMINRDDLNIDSPFGRVMTEIAHETNSGDAALIADNMLGVKSNAFFDAVQSACAPLNRGKPGTYNMVRREGRVVVPKFHLAADGSYNAEGRVISRTTGRPDPNAVASYLTPQARQGNISAEDVLCLAGCTHSSDAGTVYTDELVFIDDIPFRELPDMSHVIAPSFTLKRTDISALDLSKMPEAPDSTVEDNHMLKKISGHVSHSRLSLSNNSTLEGIDAHFPEGGQLRVSGSPSLRRVSLGGKISALKIGGTGCLNTLKLESPPERLEIAGLNRPPKTYTDTPENAARLEELMETQLGFPCPVSVREQEENTPHDPAIRNTQNISPEPK